MDSSSSMLDSMTLAPSSAVPGWTAEYAVPLGGPGHLLLATFEQAAIGIAHLTLGEEWISVNQRYCEITGYRREEILQLKLDALTHPDDIPASREFLTRIRSGELPEYKMEKRYIRKDGAVIWVHLTVSIVRASTGDPLYLVAFIEDITQRREAQHQANRSLSLLRATLESTADGILVVDVTGKILSFNQKMSDMWGISADVFASGDDAVAPKLLGGDIDVHELRARGGKRIVDGHRLPQTRSDRDEEVALAEPALDARWRPETGLPEVERMVVRERIGASKGEVWRLAESCCPRRRSPPRKRVASSLR